MPAVAVEQRGRRQLVEHDHHHRGAFADVRGRHLGVARQHELRHGRGEQEQREEQRRRRGEHGRERLQRARPPDREPVGERRPGGEREHEVEGCRQRPDPLDDLDRDQRGDGRDEDGVHDLLRPLSRQPRQRLDPDQEEWRKHHQRNREQHDVTPGRPAHGEELRVVPEQLEQRLGDGEPAQRDELERPLPEPVRSHGRSPRGVSSLRSHGDDQRTKRPGQAPSGPRSAGR